MLLTVLLVVAAHAQQGEAPAAAAGHHLARVEAWFMRPLYRSTGTWRQHRAMAWGGVLDCVETSPLHDTCRMADGNAYWAFILKDDTAQHTYAIPLKATLSVTRTRTGHVAAYDWEGDLTEFYDVASDTLGKLHHTGNGVFRSADDRRQVGQELVEDLAHALLGGLDIELPPNGSYATPWKFKDLPMAARRFHMTAGRAAIEAHYTPSDEYGPNVLFSGKATVSSGSDSYAGNPEQIELSGAAHVDQQGRVANSDIAVGVISYGALGDCGLTRYRVRSVDSLPLTAVDRAPGPCPDDGG